MILRLHQPHPRLSLILTTIVLFQVALCRRERHRQTLLINYKDPAVSDSNCIQDDHRDSDMVNSNQKDHSRHHYYSKELKQSYESSGQLIKHTPKHVKKKRLRCRLIESNTENSSNQPRYKSKYNRDSRCCRDGRHSQSSRVKSDDSYADERTRHKLKNFHIGSSSSVENSKRKNSVSISIKLKQKAQDDKNSASFSDKITYKKKRKEIVSSSNDEDSSDNQSTKQSLKCSLTQNSESDYNSSKKNKCHVACTKSLKKVKQIKNCKLGSNHKCCASCALKKSRNLSSNREKRREMFSKSSDLESYQSSSSSGSEKQEVKSSSSENVAENSSKSKSSSHQTSSSSSSEAHFPRAMNPQHPFWPYPFPSRPCLGDANRFHGQDFYDYNPFMRMPYVFGILSKQKLNNGRAGFPNLGSKTCKCKKNESHCKYNR